MNTRRLFLLIAMTVMFGCTDEMTGDDEFEDSADDAVAFAYKSIAPSASVGQSAVTSSFNDWKSKYVTTSGAGGAMRVKRTENGNDTVSEGIGYGMLLAAYMGDRSLLDGLWSYAKAHFDSRGLMHWQIDANGNVIGQNAAIDADEDMAIALIVADKKWGGSYKSDATTLIQNILNYEVESGSNVIKPGDVWGGSSVTNPSYFDPGYYHVFAAYTGNARWNQVADATYSILANINRYNASTGLVPDWVQSNGTAASGKGYDYSYDACRTPWRLAHDAQWFNDSRSIAQLDKMNAFWKSKGASNIKDGYTISGGSAGQNQNAAFTAMAAAGTVVSTDSAFTSAMWNAAVSSWKDNYYSGSLHALGLLAASGLMVNPLTIGGGAVEATCLDGIKNQGEENVDCGGPCPACAAAVVATLIPARIEAEAYVNFYDTTSAHSGNCGSGPVDMETTTDPTGGTCNVGWVAAGEWLEYSIQAAQTNVFDIVLRVASAGTGNRGHVEIDGRNVGSFSVAGSGWQSWENQTVENVSIAKGAHTVRVVFDTNDINCNYFDFKVDAAPVASCTDGVKNQNESDVDCGGVCNVCIDGKKCSAASDCQSGSCQSGICKAVVSGGSVSAVAVVNNQWNAGYCADVTISNNGSSTTKSWTLVLDSGSAAMGSPWNVNSTGTATHKTVTPLSWNAAIAPGASFTFGFCATTTTGASGLPTVESITGQF